MRVLTVVFGSFVLPFLTAFSPQSSSQNIRRFAPLSSTSIPISDPSRTQPETLLPLESSPKGAISMNVDELAEKVGGWGRARLVWDYMRIGIDPLIHFRNQSRTRTRTASSSSLETFIQDIDTNDEEIQNLLPKARRTQLLGKAALDGLEEVYKDYGRGLEGGVADLSSINTSSDGTTKLLIRFQDGLEVETVIIPFFDKGYSTICISSQVGCKQGCTFCSTGKMGKLRSLSSTEILSQFFYAIKICRLGSIPEINNVVFMGMGEPADNSDEVIDALKILTDVELFHIGHSKVIVSTVAPSPEAFKRFKDAPCVLAWSVHGANDELRKQLVPTTKYSMNELRQGLIDTLLARPKRLQVTMIEIALIAEVNDRPDDAKELANFIQVIVDSIPGIRLMVNLIPFNDIGHPTYRKPSMERVLAFQEVLSNHGILTLVRTTRGDDESAACGQLATKRAKRKAFITTDES